MFIVPDYRKYIDWKMQTFREFKGPESSINEALEIEKHLISVLESKGIQGVEDEINEGIFGSLAGFIAGPTIGKVIAKALGIQKGILYDVLTSRLVSTALGNAIQNASK